MIDLASSREVLIYGLTLVGSGASQLVTAPTFYGPLSLYLEYFGFGMVLIGALLSILGFFWKLSPRERPLGVTLLVFSFVFSGFANIVLGGWLFTPLFLLALFCFVSAWALLTRRKWVKSLLEIVAIISMLVSVLGLGALNDYVVYIPGVLGALYIFWYLNRPHVAKYLNAEPRNIILSERTVHIVLLFALLLPLFMAYFYYNPPSRSITSHINGFSDGGGAGSGTSGPEYVFYRGDILNYSFQVDSGFAPVNFSIQRFEFPLTIASSLGSSGSGVVTVPISDQYTVWAITQANSMSVRFEILVSMSSVRLHIAQWALLDLYFVGVLYFTDQRIRRLLTRTQTAKETKP